jgi:purine catabolism regulator
VYKQFQRLDEKLSISKKDELLHINNERFLLIPAKAFGILQRDLINNIGIKRIKAFFFKYGWQLGVEDAKEIEKNLSMSLMEKILHGPVYHASKGHVKAKVTVHDLEIDNGKIKTFHFKGVWENSSEAEQHIENIGLSDRPVCYSLTGYASGYVSSLIGEEVFFKELQCAGTGASCCIWEGRLLSDWQEEADELLHYSKELPILMELEQTYAKLLIEKDNLAMVTKIHSQLTAEVIKGNTIDSILEIVYSHIKKPVVVEDIYHQVLGFKGISADGYEPLQKGFSDFLKKNKLHSKAMTVHFENKPRLVTPIFLLGKIIGYCSFLYEDNKISINEIDPMIIGRVSSICSLLILNEKTKLESMQRMKVHFLEEIISGKYPSPQEIKKVASYIQLNLSGDYHVVMVTYNGTGSYEEKGLNLHNDTFETASAYFSEKDINVLIGQRTDSLFLLIPENQLNKKEIETIIHSLLSFLKKKVKNTTFYGGISSKNSNIIDAKIALDEARTAARLSTWEIPITSFADLGIIGVLINEQNESAIRKIVQFTLGNLCENLDKNKVELIDTLYNFLVNGGNLEQTAENLALSISGLRYRLNKIMDLLGRRDIRDSQVQFQMLLALKALKIMDNQLLKTNR